MMEDIEETERLLNFVLYPKPAAIVALATVRRSMLPSLEALFPGPENPHIPHPTEADVTFSLSLFFVYVLPKKR